MNEARNQPEPRTPGEGVKHYTFTRDQLIQALRTEPVPGTLMMLRAAGWISGGPSQRNHRRTERSSIMNDATITITGNLVDDPELRFTPTGQPVAKFRIAQTPSWFDKASNEWKQGEALFLTCQVWRQTAENVAESLQRGTRVMVTGRLRQHTYEAKDGTKRTVYEVEVDEVGVSLRNATVKVSKVSRSTPDKPDSDKWASESADSSPAEPPF